MKPTRPSPPPVTCEVRVKAIPNAPRNAVAGRLGEAWKIKVRAVPEDGKANHELTLFLAETLALPRHAVELLSGASSREKRFRITGLAENEVTARLAAAL